MVAGATKLARARASLSERLQARRPELEQAILTRVYGVSDTSGIGDPEYADGLRIAVSVAVVYGLTAIEQGDERVPPVPPVLLLQARAAARAGISLDTVLRRYVAGYALLGDFLLEEAAHGGILEEESLKGVLRVQTAILDRLLAAVSEEYAREADTRLAGSEQRRAERVQRLLAGELIDTADLDYDLGDHHLGVISVGEAAESAIRGLGASFDCRVLLVRRGEATFWGWLGARRRLDPVELMRHAEETWPEDTPLAIGEPTREVAGWRLTHRQALAALSIAVRSPGKPVRYADVALLAAVLQDDVLTTSLRRLYLAPLAEERDGGETLRKTLRAYFAAERNVSSAAAALGVSRRTVTNRLRAIESKLDRPLSASMTDIEVALGLEGLNAMPGASPPPGD